MTSEAPHCHHPEKDTACQPAVVRAMLKGKEGLPLSINSVFLKMLKKDDDMFGTQIQLLVCFSLAGSEAYGHV